MDTWSKNYTEFVKDLAIGSLGGDKNGNNDLDDPILGKVLASKQEIEDRVSTGDEEKGKEDEFVMAVCKDDEEKVEALVSQHHELSNRRFPEEERGFTALIYAICFDKLDIVDALVEKWGADPDVADTVVGYTPLMWAVYLNRLAMVKVLMNNQADPYATGPDGKTAASLLSIESVALYDYFKSHNLLGPGSYVEENDDLFGKSFGDRNDDEIDDLNNRIKMQSIAAKADILENWETNEEEMQREQADEEANLADDPVIRNTKTFDYEKLLSDQYIKFTDSDIPSLLDYIFALRSKRTSFQHDTKTPAAILFQLIRYSHQKVGSEELTNFLFECFTARLRSVTNTKSGVFSLSPNDEKSGESSGDIVLLGYWLSVLQFLHFYFAKIDLYVSYPKFLQEMVNLNQSLIATLSFSTNVRLNSLLDDCLLNFTNLVDVSNVLYAKDWNIFKNRKKMHPSNFEDIIDMLYPPTERELMKPSPIRYIQVIGALDYVLNLHQVNSFIQAQVFSQVFYFVNAVIFNRIISTSKYCSRAKAIQIRLNISAVEDWLRTHSKKVQKPKLEEVGHITKLLGQYGESIHLYNVLLDKPDQKDPHCILFYYNTLYRIGISQLQPTIELLQWLQCMTHLKDESNLISTVNQFSMLNYFQLVKVATKLYRYEIEEPKFPKSLVNVLKQLQNNNGEKQVSRINLQYMTQSKLLLKEEYIYINPNYIFGVSLLNMGELINHYGSGYGGIHVLKAKKYQPSLPVSVSDDIDDILSQNNNDFNDSYDYELKNGTNGDEEFDESRQSIVGPSPSSISGVDNLASTADYTGGLLSNGYAAKQASPLESFKGDEIFKEVKLPGTLAHKNWGDDDIEANPW